MGRIKDKLIETYHHECTDPCETDFMTEEEIEKAMNQTQDDYLESLGDRVVQEGVDKGGIIK